MYNHIWCSMEVLSAAGQECYKEPTQNTVLTNSIKTHTQLGYCLHHSRHILFTSVSVSVQPLTNYCNPHLLWLVLSSVCLFEPRKNFHLPGRQNNKNLPAALFRLISIWPFQIAILAAEHVKWDLPDIRPHQCYHLQTTKVHYYYWTI